MVMLLGMDGEKEPEHALDESKLLSAVFQVVDRTSVPHVPLLNIIAFIHHHQHLTLLFSMLASKFQMLPITLYLKDLNSQQR